MLFKLYLLALAAALVTAGLFVFGGQSAGHPRDYGPLPVGRGLSLPPHTEVAECATLVVADLRAGRRRHPVHLAACSARSISGSPRRTGRLRQRPSRASCSRSSPSRLSSSPRPAARGSLRAVAGRQRAAGLDRACRRSRSSPLSSRSWSLIGGVIPHPREHALGATAAALLGYVALHAGDRAALPGQQSAARRRRLRLAAAADRPAPDAALARLHAVTGAIALALVLALPALVGMLEARPMSAASGPTPPALVARASASAFGAARSRCSMPCMPSVAPSRGHPVHCAWPWYWCCSPALGASPGSGAPSPRRGPTPPWGRPARSCMPWVSGPWPPPSSATAVTLGPPLLLSTCM